MKNLDIKTVSEEIFNLSEDSIYDIIDKLQDIDKSLTYIYIKAFYIHSVKLYLEYCKKLEYFEGLYDEYKNNLIIYYKNNNSQISNDLLKDIIEAFDKSFEINESLNFSDFEDGYEYRHHIIETFKLLRNILEKKSKNKIREDIFDNYISTFRNKSEEIMDYISKFI